MAELKSCPFCGYEKAGIQYHESKFLGQRQDGIKRIQFRAYGYCKKCKSRGKPITVVIDDVGVRGWVERFREKAFPQAMEMWNRRAEEQDMVRVVRCRDCKYYDQEGVCSIVGGVWDEYEYCSEGERRDAESEPSGGQNYD